MLLLLLLVFSAALLSLLKKFFGFLLMSYYTVYLGKTFSFSLLLLIFEMSCMMFNYFCEYGRLFLTPRLLILLTPPVDLSFKL